MTETLLYHRHAIRNRKTGWSGRITHNWGTNHVNVVVRDKDNPDTPVPFNVLGKSERSIEIDIPRIPGVDKVIVTLSTKEATEPQRITYRGQHLKNVQYDMGNNGGIETVVVGESTHRVVLENYDHRMIVLAKGGQDFCEGYVDNWVRNNHLPPLCNLLILTIESFIPGPEPKTFGDS